MNQDACPEDTVRIAMWSGPRNISTAMMRAFENRPDCEAIDEPLYAHYLRATGLEHPGRATVLAAQDNDWRRVVEQLTGARLTGARIQYQKHMTHHLCGDMTYAWLGKLRHGLLLREPAAMLLSLSKVLSHVTLSDTGLPQQLALLRRLHAQGAEPLVVDSSDILRQPERALRSLCEWFGIAFVPDMLSWPPGPRASDGVWAEHWYASVHASTGFAPYVEREVSLPPELASLLPACQEIYDELAQGRLVIEE